MRFSASSSARRASRVSSSVTCSSLRVASRSSIHATEVLAHELVKVIEHVALDELGRDPRGVAAAGAAAHLSAHVGPRPIAVVSVHGAEAARAEERSPQLERSTCGASSPASLYCAWVHARQSLTGPGSQVGVDEPLVAVDALVGVEADEVADRPSCPSSPGAPREYAVRVEPAGDLPRRGPTPQSAHTSRRWSARCPSWARRRVTAWPSTMTTVGT
jgi:hypothetical protein